MIFFFFFQAEDGIRDFHVTGVQTCALPISPETEKTSVSPTYSVTVLPASWGRTVTVPGDGRLGSGPLGLVVSEEVPAAPAQAGRRRIKPKTSTKRRQDVNIFARGAI